MNVQLQGGFAQLQSAFVDSDYYANVIASLLNNYYSLINRLAPAHSMLPVKKDRLM